MKQYKDLIQRILDEGEMIENKRTNTKCLTVINHDLVLEPDTFPLCTLRKSYYKQAIGEILGYIRGYTKTEQFHQLGVKTWDANSQNPHWTNSPFYQSIKERYGDLGLIYGAVGNEIEKFRLDEHNELYNSTETISILPEIIEKIKAGNDDRGLIWSFWNPAFFDLGCLRPCLYQHQFSLINDTLYLNSTQRSCDTLLGLNFNLVQSWWLLWLMCKLTGKKQGKVFYKIVNSHIYQNQLSQLAESKMLEREPFTLPTLKYVGKEITWDYVLNEMHPNDFEVENYQYHPPIKFNFTV